MAQDELLHPLDRYLRKNEIPRAEFAQRIGIRVSHLTLVFQGKRRFSLQVAVKIEKATAGKIKAVDLLDQGTVEAIRSIARSTNWRQVRPVQMARAVG